jgi:hypothetical protein
MAVQKTTVESFINDLENAKVAVRKRYGGRVFTIGDKKCTLGQLVNKLNCLIKNNQITQDQTQKALELILKLDITPPPKGANREKISSCRRAKQAYDRSITLSKIVHDKVDMFSRGQFTNQIVFSRYLREYLHNKEDSTPEMAKALHKIFMTHEALTQKDLQDAYDAIVFRESDRTNITHFFDGIRLLRGSLRIQERFRQLVKFFSEKGFNHDVKGLLHDLDDNLSEVDTIVAMPQPRTVPKLNLSFVTNNSTYHDTDGKNTSTTSSHSSSTTVQDNEKPTKERADYKPPEIVVTEDNTQRTLENTIEIPVSSSSSTSSKSRSSTEQLYENLPTTLQLVDEYSKRAWNTFRVDYTGSGESRTLYGYDVDGKDLQEWDASRAADQERLLEIVNAHNQQFSSKVPNKGLNCAGYLEKLDLEEGSQIYIRADLHSDLRSLITQLKTLQQQGLMDANFTCSKGFHLVFLGDYMDRGINDIEVMSLLLTLKMSNPNSVHLVRGNHEDVKGVQLYSSAFRSWLDSHEREMSACYDTFPLALCVSGKNTSAKEEKKDVQYTLMTHALFAPHVDLLPFLEGNEQHLELSELVKIPRRWKEILQNVNHPKRNDVLTIQEWIGRSHDCTTRELFTWTRMDDVGRAHLPDTNYFGLHKEIRSWMKLNRIKQIERGHDHFGRDEMAKKKSGKNKVIIKTLPAGNQTGIFNGQEQGDLQGVLVTVTGQKIKNWTQQHVIAQGSGNQFNLTIDKQKTPLLDPTLKNTDQKQ